MKKIKRPLFFSIEIEEHYYYILGRSMPINQDRMFIWITEYELQDRINRLKQFAKKQGRNAVFLSEVNGRMG